MGRIRKGAVTWKMVHTDFKVRYPTYYKRSIGWQPYSYATIIVYLPNNENLTYNYDTKEVKFI